MIMQSVSRQPRLNQSGKAWGAYDGMSLAPTKTHTDSHRNTHTLKSQGSLKVIISSDEFSAAKEQCAIMQAILKPLSDEYRDCLETNSVR